MKYEKVNIESEEVITQANDYSYKIKLLNKRRIKKFKKGLPPLNYETCDTQRLLR